MRTKILIVISVCLFLLGLFLRLYKLDLVPEGLYWDETAILVDVQNIIKSGKDMHGNFFLQSIYPSYGDYKAPGLPITASLVALVFGASGWSLRLVSVLAWVMASFAGIGCLWIWLRRASLNARLSMVAAFLLVTSITPWSFFFSRVAFESFLGQAWMIVSVFFLLSALQSQKQTRKSWFFYLASLLFGVIAGYTYFADRYIWPAVVGLLFAYNFFSTKNKSFGLFFSLGGKFLLILSAYIILLLPLTRSPIYQQSQRFRLSTQSLISATAQMSQVMESNSYKKMLNNSLLSRAVFHRKVFFLRDFASNIAKHLDPNYLFVVGDSNLRHGTGRHGLLLLTFLPLFIWGILALWQKNKPLLVLLIGWYWLAIVPASIAEETPHAMRSLAGLFPLLAITTLGVLAATAWLQQHRSIGKRLLFAGGCALILFDVFSYYYYYFGDYKYASATAWQVGYSQIANVVKKNRHPGEKVLLDFPDGRLYLWFLEVFQYPPQQLRQFSFENYQLSAFDNLYFSQLPKSQSQLQPYSLIFLSQAEAKALESLPRIKLIPTASWQLSGKKYLLERIEWQET